MKKKSVLLDRKNSAHLSSSFLSFKYYLQTAMLHDTSKEQVYNMNSKNDDMTTYQKNAYTTESELGQQKDLYLTGKTQSQRQNANLERNILPPVTLPAQDGYPLQQASTLSNSANVCLLQPQNTQMIVVRVNYFILICSILILFYLDFYSVRDSPSHLLVEWRFEIL